MRRASSSTGGAGEPHEDARRPVAKRCPLVEELQAPGRHEVNEHRDAIAGAVRGRELDHGHLPHPPDAGDSPPRERRQRRIDRLQGHHARGKRRLHPGVAQTRVKAADRDLDFG